MLTTFYQDLVGPDELGRAFAARELAGQGVARDRAPLGEAMTAVLSKAFDAGFLGILLPIAPEVPEGRPEDAPDRGTAAPAGNGDARGGLGVLCVVLGRICREDASLGGVLFANAMAQRLLGEAGDWALLERLGSADTLREALVAWPIYADPSELPALPEARPLAEGRDGNAPGGQDGGDHLLTGRVELVVPGLLAARALLPARIPGSEGWSLFLVDLPGPGVSVGPPVLTLGLQGCPASDVTLEGARARLVGAPGQGARCFARAAGPLAVGAAAMNVGILEGAFAEARAYAAERRQGGRPIAEWSALGMILGELGVKAEAARMCMEAACLGLLRNEAGSGRRALAAALHVHELACQGVTDGVQILGGYGYMKDYGQEKRFRDARQVRALLGLGPAWMLSLAKEEP